MAPAVLTILQINAGQNHLRLSFVNLPDGVGKSDGLADNVKIVLAAF